VVSIKFSGGVRDGRGESLTRGSKHQRWEGLKDSQPRESGSKKVADASNAGGIVMIWFFWDRARS